jgi:ribose-phosphate pyrophosphokinase
MIVFAGSSNKSLAKRLARKLETRLGKMELSRFANDEARVWVKERKIGKKVMVVQSLAQPTDHNLVEFGLIADALRRMGASSITAVIPWLGYSKQDKVFRPGEPLSVKVIAKMLQVVPLEKVITFDLHNLAILGFFEIPVVNLSAQPLFTSYFKPRLTDKTVVVAPDAGAVKASTGFAQKLGVPVAYIDKKRDLNTGKVAIVGISRRLKGARVIIIDDMIVTGDTLIKTGEFLKKQGVQLIEVAVTHHLYVPGVQKKLDKSAIDRLVVTDTIEPREKSRKLKILSVAELIARELS